MLSILQNVFPKNRVVRGVPRYRKQKVLERFKTYPILTNYDHSRYILLLLPMNLYLIVNLVLPMIQPYFAAVVEFPIVDMIVSIFLSMYTYCMLHVSPLVH
jgi:hypothetical protein